MRAHLNPRRPRCRDRRLPTVLPPVPEGPLSSDLGGEPLHPPDSYRTGPIMGTSGPLHARRDPCPARERERVTSRERRRRAEQEVARAGCVSTGGVVGLPKALRLFAALIRGPRRPRCRGRRGGTAGCAKRYWSVRVSVAEYVFRALSAIAKDADPVPGGSVVLTRTDPENTPLPS